MGWRERDYARWTDEERRRFLGPSASSSFEPRGSGGGRSVYAIRPVNGALLAVVVSLALFLLGHVPASRPLVPFLDFRLPALPGSSLHPGRIDLGDGTARLGSRLTLHGTVPHDALGQVVVERSFDGSTWETVAVVDGSAGTYEATVSLDRPGLLRLRIVFANGRRTEGAVTVT